MLRQGTQTSETTFASQLSNLFYNYGSRFWDLWRIMDPSERLLLYLVFFHGFAGDPFIQKGEVLDYVKRIQNLKDLKHQVIIEMPF